MIVKRFLSLISIVLLLVTAILGCADVSESVEPTDIKKAPEPVKWFRVGLPSLKENDPIIMELEKKSHIKIEFISAPWDAWSDRIKLMITTGENVDLVMIPFESVPYHTWAKDGLIVDWSMYVKKDTHPYLYSLLNSPRGKQFYVDGKAVIIPQITTPGTWGIILRKDWLDRVELPVPESIEDYIKVIKAFNKNICADKGNKYYGYCAGFAEGNGGGVDLLMASPLFHAYGGTVGPHLYLKDKTGRYYDPEISNTQREAYKQLRNMFMEGIINRDAFRLTKDQVKEKFREGLAGITMYDNSPVYLKDEMKEKDAELIKVAPPIGPAGNQGIRGSVTDYWLGAVIPSSSNNPQKAVDLFEFMASAEGRKITKFGVEGIHYDLINGNITAHPEAFRKWYGTAGFPASWGMVYSGMDYIDTVHNRDFETALKNPVNWTEGDPYVEFTNFNNRFTITSAIVDSTIPGVSALTGSLEKTLSKWRARFLSEPGVDIDREWKMYVEEMKKSGLEEILRLINQNNQSRN